MNAAPEIVMASLVGLCIGYLIGLAIASLINAVFFRVACEFCNVEDTPDLGFAFKMMFGINLAIVIIGVCGGVAVGAYAASTEMDPGQAQLLIMIMQIGMYGLWFIIFCSVVSSNLRDVSFGRAALLAFCMFLATLSIAVTIGLDAFGFMLTSAQ